MASYHDNATLLDSTATTTTATTHCRHYHNDDQPTQPPTNEMHHQFTTTLDILCMNPNNIDSTSFVLLQQRQPWNNIRQQSFAMERESLSRKRMIHIIGAAYIMIQTDPIDN